MNFSFKFKILLGGLISAAFLFLLTSSFKAFTPIQLPIICSFSGPENSPDLLRLTDFLVTGPSNPKVGDTIYVSFKLQNYGQYDLNLGSKGIFVAGKDPDNLDASFGFSLTNTVFKVGNTSSLSVTKYLDKAGTWKFWPSYHLTFAGAPEKFGPNEWHVCTIQVAQPVQDSDQDGVPDNEDNCPQNYNPQQEDIDGDNIGDVCDSCDDRDTDKDKIKNCLDKCPNEPENYNQYQDEDGCPDEIPVPEDTTPPVVDISASPIEPHPNDKITFSAKARDPSGIKKITIFVSNIVKRECVSKCQTSIGCFELREEIGKFGKEYLCSFTGGPYPIGTLTYKAEAVDGKGNKGDSDEKQTEVKLEITTPPPTFTGCFYSISGSIFNFPYDYETLKIKSCPLTSLRTISICPPGTEKFTNVSSETRQYKIEGLCANKSYLIQPIYQRVEGVGKCQWQGSWEPEKIVVELGESNVVGKNFRFTPVETNKPRVTSLDYTHTRPSGIVSDADLINFYGVATDDEGIAKIQFLQQLDYGTGYGDWEIIKEYDFSTFPSVTRFGFQAGPYSGAKKIRIKGRACDKNGNLDDGLGPIVSISLTADHCLNEIKDADEQDINCGGADCQRCPETCDDGIQNRDETGVDCGGRYCPPCSRCETGAKWAPNDTPCRHHWPTDEGPRITGNTTADSCELYELCHPELDYIVQDAITCCEHSDFERRFSGHRETGKETACRYARTTSGIDIAYNPTSFKKCLGIYAISGLGGAAVYMQGYFYGELCCYGDSYCPSGCSKWRVNPAAWEMGTALSCAGPGGATPDFQMGGHRCVYYDFWIFGNSGKSGWWHSDTDWQSNNDSFADIPAHASINRLSTGTCVDYSVALTTILRKIGYSKDEVFSVDGDEHWYNLVKFPGETKWNYVDTVGNRGGEIFGGIGYTKIYDNGRLVAWYDYCKNMDDGCSNDYYSESRSRCPSNNEIYTCEGISR